MLANFITYTRMFFLIPISILVYTGNFNVALFLFVIASLTDWLDGFVARKTRTVSETGKVMDQIADKVLITGIMVVFVDVKLLPAWLVIAVVWRDLIVSAVRILAAKGGIVIAANYFGKVKTVSQMVLVIVILMKDIFYNELLIKGLIWIVFIATVLSGVIYLYQNRDALRL